MKTLFGAIGLSLMLLSGSVIGAAAGSPTPNGYGVDVSCRYRSVPVEGWDWKMELRRLRVDPPTAFAKRAQQTVGWRFVVQRRSDVNTTWKRIHVSPIQKSGPLGYLQYADFTRMTFDVPHPNQPGTDYRVVVKIYWYASNGSLQSRDRFLINDYRVLRDGELVWYDRGDCEYAWLSNQ